ncbi:MAG: YopJ family acetyltransferase [Gammaproteobacteria bacterium]|nr:YopJ family acetyltransferase [Gammaproteobacteria bacterium]
MIGREPKTPAERVYKTVWRDLLVLRDEIHLMESQAPVEKLKENPEYKKNYISALRNLSFLLQEINKPDHPFRHETKKQSEAKLHRDGTIEDIHYLFNDYAARIQKLNWIKDLNGLEISQVLQNQSSRIGLNNGFGLASMNVLIAIEKQKRPNFNCQTIDITELNKSLDQLFKNYKQIPEDISHRAQLIINNGSHYSTVDFHISREGVQFILLDAANEPRVAAILDIFMKRDEFTEGFQVGTDRGIQKDYLSCPIFALDHAIQISQLDLYEDLLTIQNEYSQITWFDMPPELVRNAQSPSWIQEYKEQYLRDHAEISPQELDAKFPPAINKVIRHAKSGKESNCLNSTDILFEKYSKNILKFIKDVSPEELVALYRNADNISSPLAPSVASTSGILTNLKVSPSLNSYSELNDISENKQEVSMDHTTNVADNVESNDVTDEEKLDATSQPRYKP